MEVKKRLVDYYNNNEFSRKYIKGMDFNTNEIILAFADLEKRITIEELENITTEEQIISLLNNTNLKETPLEEPKIDMVEPRVISSEVDKETLNDIKILTEIKSKTGLDNVLKHFAINESTGLIDINKAISIVEKNTIDEVIKSIKEKKEFDLDLENYDITGKYLGISSPSERTTDEKIMSSFNNVRVYLEAANMYVEQAHFTEDDINNKMKEYIDKVKGILNPVKVEPTPILVKQVESNQLEQQNAGFADIFVLCVIVIVYAIIIVNLVLKLV